MPPNGRNEIGRRSLRFAPALVALALLTGASLESGGEAGALAAGAQAGDETVEYVRNPAVPAAESACIELEPLWRIESGEGEGQIRLGRIAGIVADDRGNAYVLDQESNNIKVFSKSGELLRTIGRQGQGPGEFRNPASIFFRPDGNIGVMQMMPNRISVLTPLGLGVEDMFLPGLPSAGFQAVERAMPQGDHLIVSGRTSQFQGGKVQQSFFLSKLDAGGRELVRLHERNVSMSLSSMVVDEEQIQGAPRWAADEQGRVYALIDFRDYRIHMWGPEGRLERIIEREYQPHRRTEDEKRRLIERLSEMQQPGVEIHFEIDDFERAVDRLEVRNDGSLWAFPKVPADRLPDGSIALVDEFDESGRFARQLCFTDGFDPEVDGLIFSGDRLFVVEELLQSFQVLAAESGAENETAPALACYRIDVPEGP